MPHARLSPSKAERWMTCPGSVAFAAGYPDRVTRAAAEGTACHAVLSRWLNGGKPATEGEVVRVDGFGSVELTEEMVDWIGECETWVRDYLAAHHTAMLLSEESICPGHAFNCPGDLWGTADVLIATPEELVVFDAKFGYRPVGIEDNPQLLLYAIGAQSEFGWVFPSLRLVICQPRNGGVKSLVVSADYLKEKIREFAPKVRAALDPSSPLVASAVACEWCPAAGACPEAQSKALAVARNEFSIVPTTTEELLVILNHADQIRAALDSAERYAESLLAVGQDLPGWKRVLGNKRRIWKDPAAAERVLRKLGYDPYRAQTVKTPAQAEKMVGKATAGQLADLIERPKGEPKLARASDPGEPLAPDFPAD